MCVVRRDALGKLVLTSNGMAFSEELKVEAIIRSLNIAEVHIHYGRRVGRKKLRMVRDGIENLVFLLRKRLRTKT